MAPHEARGNDTMAATRREAGRAGRRRRTLRPDSGVDCPGAGVRGGRRRVRCVAVPGRRPSTSAATPRGRRTRRRHVHAAGLGDGHAEPSGDTVRGTGTIYATTSSTKELGSSTDFRQDLADDQVHVQPAGDEPDHQDPRHRPVLELRRCVLVDTPGYTYVVGASVDGDGRRRSPVPLRHGSAVADGSGLADVTLSYASRHPVLDHLPQGDGTITGNPHIGIRSSRSRRSTC